MTTRDYNIIDPFIDYGEIPGKYAAPVDLAIELQPRREAGTLYVQGFVFEKGTDTLLPGIVIQQIENSTGKPLEDPFTLIDGSYSAWCNVTDRFNIAIKFSGQGYAPQTIRMSVLETTPDVYLIKKSGFDFPWWYLLIIAAAVATYRKRSGKVGKLESSDLFPIFMIAGGIIGISVISKVINALGLGGDPTADEQADPKSAFKPGYWQTFNSYTYSVSQEQAIEYADTIHDAFTVFEDDYNAILSVFSSMRTKANVSFIAWTFMKRYDEDLLSFLTNGGGVLPWDGLSHTHLKTILNLVAKLPTN